MFRLVFKKAEEQEIKSSTSLDHQEGKRIPEKTSVFALLNMPKILTVWITVNCGKF